MLCEYGCGQLGLYQFKNGKWCCSEYFKSCPEVRKKSSKIMKDLGSVPWNKDKKNCFSDKTLEKMRTNFEFIKKYIEDAGYILISTKEEYKNCHTSRLNVICPNNHLTNICWGEFKRRRCYCAICSGLKKKTIEEVCEYISKFNYKCLSKEYINWKSKLEFQCPEGHIYKTTWAIFQQGARCPECERLKRIIKYSGSACTFWKGGISKEPYCQDWIPEFKNLIKDRDGNICLNPECSSGKNICIHHIDYNKKNCRFDNLITICKSCNAKANFDRKWHTLWYQAILLRRYNYQYYK